MLLQFCIFSQINSRVQRYYVAAITVSFIGEKVYLISRNHMFFEKYIYIFMSSTILKVLRSKDFKGTIFFLIEVINSK